MAAVSGPVAPPQYSSQPMEGGLAHGSPSMSTPPAKAALPAPRQGEAAPRCQASVNCGSAARLPGPPRGSGVAQQ